MVRFTLLLSGFLTTLPAACGPPASPKAPRDEAARRTVERMEGHCRRGRRLWRSACSGQTLHGLCVAPSTRLADGALPPAAAMRPRRADLVSQALRAYEAAWKIWDRGRVTSDILVADPRRKDFAQRLRECAAEAAFVRVEPFLVRLLRQGPPRMLDFDPANPAQARESVLRLAAWLRLWMRRAAALVDRYNRVILDARAILESDGKLRSSPRWSLASLARTAQIYRAVARNVVARAAQVGGLRMPAWSVLRSQFAGYVVDLRRKATRHYKLCLEVQQKLGVDANLSWVKLCRKGLAAVR